jgi:hypothetical protein
MGGLSATGDVLAELVIGAARHSALITTRDEGAVALVAAPNHNAKRTNIWMISFLKMDGSN